MDEVYYKRRIFKSVKFSILKVNMKDSFGEVMEKNLQQRGIVLPGLTACTNIESQKQR